MTDLIRLRGHHLLCMLGFRGMGYSKEFVEHMKNVYNQLRIEPQTEVLIVTGPDELCHYFPDNQCYHCEDKNVADRDQQILVKLGLHSGQKLAWQSVESRIRQHMHPSDIAVLCSTCSWRSYGVCEEGVQRIKEGYSLLPLPKKSV
ncbi:DUF1284 domain-containing protein [Alicyclobacillus tolerans]|uniref:DUF1284 domain-containing protein n=1 Tax=Alicyclobacillus tolerans TaxID=90970 RepID=UPI003B790294